MKKIVSATEARKDFFALLRFAAKPGSNVVVTLEDSPSIIMLSQEEFEGWIETMEVMADKQLMADIRESVKEKGGITLEELEKEMHE